MWHCSHLRNYKKDNKVLFINSLINIKAYYECNVNIEKTIIEDICLLASFNHIPAYKASYSLINFENIPEE